MDWLKVRVTTEKPAEEIISEIMLSAGAQGVSVEGDNKNCVDHTVPWDYLNDEVLAYVPFSVTAYYPCDDTESLKVTQIKHKLRELRAMDLGIPLGELAVHTARVHEQDWANSWKTYFKPVKVSESVVIKPTWEAYQPLEGEHVIEIDPGMAFGTGNHETTRMCVQLLEEYVEEGMCVVDAGCGSGILSVATAMFGAKQVYALDLDPVAVEVTRENAVLNHCEDRITVRKSNLLDALEPEVRADIVVANIIADIVILLNEQVQNILRHNGMYICSGIIDSRVEDVKRSLEQKGFRIIQILSDGEWRAIACKNRK